MGVLLAEAGAEGFELRLGTTVITVWLQSKEWSADKLDPGAPASRDLGHDPESRNVVRQVSRLRCRVSCPRRASGEIVMGRRQDR